MVGMRARLSQAQGSAPRRDDAAAAAQAQSGSADVRETVLALQRSAGNRAVAGLVGRRLLQRSSTDEDIAQQRLDDVDAVNALLETGTTQIVNSVEPDPGEPF